MVAVVLAVALGGCGGGQATTTRTAPAGVRITASFGQGPILVQHISYTTFDGSQVPALFSIPRAAAPRGCVIWEDGFRSRKEGTEPLWAGAARLGLAMFSIDLRDHGQRASGPTELTQAVDNPTLLKALVTGTIRDLKRAVDYLWSQPICRHNIGYAGLSLGGIIGSVLAAQDPRIHVVLLMSVPPSYLSVINVTNELLPGIRHEPARLAAALRLLSPLDPDRWIGRISPRPLLLVFGRQDPLVPPSSAQRTIAAARQPKTVIDYSGGHIPFFGSAAATNAQQIGTFVLKYLVEPTYPPGTLP